MNQGIHPSWVCRNASFPFYGYERHQKAEVPHAEAQGFLQKRADIAANNTIRKSIKTYVSEIKTWIKYCQFLGFTSCIEPSVPQLRAFLGLFSNPFSGEKYLQAVRWAHVRLCLDTSAFDHESIKQIKKGGKKDFRAQFGVAFKPAITFLHLDALVNAAVQQGETEQAALYALAMNFLFRVPSELLPLCMDNLQEHSRVTFTVGPDGKAILRIDLKTRKNCPDGSSLERKCACRYVRKDGTDCEGESRSSLDMRLDGERERRVFSLQRSFRCAPCALIAHIKKKKMQNIKGRLFNTSKDQFQTLLRRHAHTSMVPHADALTSKVFRRGGARELLRHGGNLRDVLAAGQWRSAGFLQYILLEEVEEAALFEIIAERDDGEGNVRERLKNLSVGADKQPAKPNPPAATGKRAQKPAVTGQRPLSEYLPRLASGTPGVAVDECPIGAVDLTDVPQDIIDMGKDVAAVGEDVAMDEWAEFDSASSTHEESAWAEFDSAFFSRDPQESSVDSDDDILNRDRRSVPRKKASKRLQGPFGADPCPPSLTPVVPSELPAAGIPPQRSPVAASPPARAGRSSTAALAPSAALFSPATPRQKPFATPKKKGLNFSSKKADKKRAHG